MSAPRDTPRESLRDFQARLAEKLKAAEDRSTAPAKLGLLAGGRHWLVDLDQVNEVVTAPQLTSAPWSQPWFIGVTSVRGMIYGCVDFAAYAGVAPPLPRGESRLLLAHPRFGLQVALRVERALGLRPQHELIREPDAADTPHWVTGQWRGKDGQAWTEINIQKLVSDAAFLEASR